MRALAVVVMVCAVLGDGSALEDALTKEIVLGEGLEGGKGFLRGKLPTSANSQHGSFILDDKRVQSPTAARRRWTVDSGCHSTCKRQHCTGGLSTECTSCAMEDKWGIPRDWMLWAKKFKGTVPEGGCISPPTLKDFITSSSGGVKCRFSECRDAASGYVLTGAYATTVKKVCTRICLFGGSQTSIRDLERYDNPEKRTGRRLVDAKFASIVPNKGYSEPVCSLHKIVMCTNNKEFHHGNCQKFRNKQPGGKAAHCEQENCHVQKKVGCVAILPPNMKDNAHKALGADLSAYTNECTHAINPCDQVALYI